MAIANLQYAWTLFINPLAVNLQTTLAAVQVAFAALILAETWLVPIAGHRIERLGPGVMIALQNRSRIDSKGGKRNG
jgi:OFA family oxalate/formate antiporter-like MFS transporter